MEGFNKNVILPFERYTVLKNAWESQNGLTDSKIEQNSKKRLDPNLVLKMVPVKLRHKCERLLESISDRQDFDWDEQARVTIFNHHFSNSNLSDLLNYAVNSFSSFIPEGAADFMQLLIKANVPLSLINKNHRDTIKGDKSDSHLKGGAPGIPEKIKYRDLAEWSWT